MRSQRCDAGAKVRYGRAGDHSSFPRYQITAALSLLPPSHAVGRMQDNQDTVSTIVAVHSARGHNAAEKSSAMRTRVYDGFVKVDKVETSAGPREVVVATDSVAFLVYNRDRDEVLLASQDRVPMMEPNNPQGTLLEVGAGRFDLEIGVRGLVVKELKEELGVTATQDEVHVLNDEIPLALSPGVITERQYLAYVEITTDRIDPSDQLYGNHEEGEAITRHFIPVSELSKIQIHDMKTWALLQWFRARNGA